MNETLRYCIFESFNEKRMNSSAYQMQWSDYPSESSSQVLYKTLPVAPYDNYYSYNSQITPSNT